MDRKAHINFWYFAVDIVEILLFQQVWLEDRQLETTTYSEFPHVLQTSKIDEIGIADTNIRSKLKEITADGHQYIYTVRALALG